MRVLHYYPKDDSMIASYVTMLTQNMGLESQNLTATHQGEARELLQQTPVDILHIHGCWQASAARLSSWAVRHKTRIVISPHGQLEPWVFKENYWKEKLPKRMTYLRRLITSAYAIVIQGRMEEECLQRLAWNSRLVIIRNALITHSITPKEMARQMSLLYRQVLDSNPIALMDDTTHTMLRQLIKAGITGDRRWLREEAVTTEDQEQWRHVLCYARQEQIESTLRRGIRVLGYDRYDVDIESSSCFMPDHYKPSTTIQEEIGSQFVTEEDRLIATFRQIRKLLLHRQLTIAHLCELDKELREHDTEEEQLCELLKDARLYKLASRTMSLLRDMTGLDEGMMPMPPCDDRITRQMKLLIYNHLKI